MMTKHEEIQKGVIFPAGKKRSIRSSIYRTKLSEYVSKRSRSFCWCRECNF